MATDAPNGTAESELTELDKYWNAVRSNPNDFTGWTYLLQYVEQEVCNMTIIRVFICYYYNEPSAVLIVRHYNH